MVSVCEERAIGIPIMLLDDSTIEVIILDDAFQHRQVKAGLSILLTEYSKPFTSDLLLPAGNLRESPLNAARADVIVVTKSPLEISSEEKLKLSDEIRQKENQPVLFSSLEYDEPYKLFDPLTKLDFASIHKAVLVTGIASIEHLLNELTGNIKILQHFKFPDHHHYSLSEIKEIVEQSKNSDDRSIILTTEKDGVRLLKFREFLISEQVEIYCVPVKVKFTGDDKTKIDSMILQFVEDKIKAATE
jgi:tetraacyldisaccharide 4'-kinase